MPPRSCCRHWARGCARRRCWWRCRPAARSPPLAPATAAHAVDLELRLVPDASSPTRPAGTGARRSSTLVSATSMTGVPLPSTGCPAGTRIAATTPAMGARKRRAIELHAGDAARRLRLFTALSAATSAARASSTSCLAAMPSRKSRSRAGELRARVLQRRRRSRLLRVGLGTGLRSGSASTCASGCPTLTTSPSATNTRSTRPAPARPP